MLRVLHGPSRSYGGCRHKEGDLRGDLRRDGPAAWGLWCPRCKEEAAATRLCRSFCQYRDQRGESPAGQGSFPAGFAGRKTPLSKSLDRICLNFETAEGEPSRRLLPRLCPLPGTNPGPGRVGAEGGRGRGGLGPRGGSRFLRLRVLRGRPRSEPGQEAAGRLPPRGGERSREKIVIIKIIIIKKKMKRRLWLGKGEKKIK